MKLLSNLFKVYWKYKKCWHYLFYADVISFFVTRKSQQIGKIDANRWKWLILTEKVFIFLNDTRNSNEVFKKDVTYDNIKSHKKSWFYPLFRRYIFRKAKGKIRGRGQVENWLQAILGLICIAFSAWIW